ncbi:MAG: PilZ domain-containing protein, partial [Pseudaminobacter sp.]
DLSLSGAALSGAMRPLVGTDVMLGRVAARVVRHLEEGFAIEFNHPQSLETVEDNVTARI